jgi:hypothetical protein
MSRIFRGPNFTASTRAGRNSFQLGPRHRGNPDYAVNYTMIGDTKLEMATAYDMPREGVTCDGRTAADNFGQDKKAKAMLTRKMNVDHMIQVAVVIIIGLTPLCVRADNVSTLQALIDGFCRAVDADGHASTHDIAMCQQYMTKGAITHLMSRPEGDDSEVKN